MAYKDYIFTGREFKTFKEAEKYVLNTKSPNTSYAGIYQIPDCYSGWYMFKKSPSSYAKKFIQNPNRNDIDSHHTRYEEDILKLWITKKNGKYLKKPKLVWKKKKGQINQKQKPEPTLEETIKKYLKKQRI
jgi:hypothetical protein